MWKLFYMIYLLEKISKNTSSEEKVSPSIQYQNKIIFTNNLKKYIGQTVTIFVLGGGYGGSGYTGLLMNVKDEYISIYINSMTLAEIPISKIACFSHNIV